MTTPDNTVVKKADNTRIRLLADRLCYLNHGTPGLIYRHGMQNADKAYRDDFDRYAEQHAAELLPERKVVQVVTNVVEWLQPSLF
jgi:hypothetical protein